jgi:SAM-dependent methyltransferase
MSQLNILSHNCTDENRKRHWDSVARAYRDVSSAYSTKLYLRGEMRLIDKHFCHLSGSSFLKLDLWNEAFNTNLLPRVLERGAVASAVDISREVVTRARENLARAGFLVDCVIGDIRELGFPTESFDYVYTMGTIEHIPEPADAVAEIYRVLKPGGRAIIGVPYRFDPFFRAAVVYVGNKLGLLPFGDEKCFSWRELLSMVNACGFVVKGRSGAYAIPWFLRFADIFLEQRAHPLTLLLRPFLSICAMLGSNEFLLRHNGLIAVFVEKP